MTYLNAPATEMLKTFCACCGRPLLDAVSVEAGVGPECRSRHGYGEQQSPADMAAFWAWNDEPTTGLDPESVEELPPDAAAHKLANILVSRIAAQQTGPAAVSYVRGLELLGYTKLAARIAERMATVRITYAEGRILVESRYSTASVEMFRRIPGRRWDAERKVNTFPATDQNRQLIHNVLRRAYAGEWAQGPKGMFQIQRWANVPARAAA